MKDLIEGDWKDFVFRFLDPDSEEDANSVLEVLTRRKNAFIHDEPISKLVGYSEQRAEYLNSAVLSFLKDKMSFIVMHKPTNEIAALQINFTGYPGRPLHPCTEPRTLTIRRFFTVMRNGLDLFEMHNVNKAAELFVTYVAPEFRRQGLTREMYKRCLEFFKASGFELVKGEFTSAFTRRVAESFGFVQLTSFAYSQFLDEKTGRCIFGDNIDPNDVCTLNVLRLK